MLYEVITDAALRQQMGMRAFDVVAANQGAQRKTLRAILATLAQAQAQAQPA